MEDRGVLVRGLNSRITSIDTKIFTKKKGGSDYKVTVDSVPLSNERILWKLVKNSKLTYVKNNQKREFALDFYKKDKHDRCVMMLEENGKKYEISSDSIRNIFIDSLFNNSKNYKFKEGQIVNGNTIIKQIRVKNGKNSTRKGYRIKCSTSKLLYEQSERDLLQNKKSPYVTSNKVWEGNSLYNQKEVMKYVINKEEAKLYTKNSQKRIVVKCPTCNEKRYIIVSELTRSGFYCSTCDNKQSYPEKLFKAILDTKGIRYTEQKVFKDLNLKRFDFYLLDYEFIVELNGMQHYIETTGWSNFKAIKINDEIKKEFLELKKIKYAIVDCRKSNMDYILCQIKNNKDLTSILGELDNSLISKHLNHLEKQIPCDKIIELYDKGYTIKEISAETNIKANTVKTTLKKFGIKMRTGKKIICLNDLKIFGSTTEAAKYYKLTKGVDITAACKKRQETAGINSKTNEKLRWVYYREYVETMREEAS